jgi:hypothetical protein
MIWWLEMGLTTYVGVLTYSMNSKRDPDWTKMPNPFSKEFQLMTFMGFFGCLFLWPLVLIGFCLPDNKN